MNQRRVVLADDEQLLRVGFRMILDAHDEFDVVAEAANGREAVSAVATHRPDVTGQRELDGQTVDVRQSGSAKNSSVKH